jgi:hypothetical protein
MGHSLNRRAAILGAAASTAALAIPAAAAVRPNTVEGLSERFRLDVMALDPSITKTWFYYDELRDGPRADRVAQIYFERDAAPFRGQQVVVVKHRTVEELQEQLRATLAAERGGDWMVCVIDRTTPKTAEWFGVPEGYGLKKDGTPL